MIQRSLLLSALLLLFLSGRANEQQDTAFQQLRKQYFVLYSEPDKVDEFYEASEKMKDYYIKDDNLDAYYKIRINEALFDTEHGFTYRAIKKANNTLEDMKRDGIKQYQVVYTVLGTIFESRGNYRMADRYYRDALSNAIPTDTGSLISIYSRLASLKSTREPEEAWKWNEHFGAMSKKTPEYYKIYLILKGQICFFLNDKEQFKKAYQELQTLLQQNPSLNNYGIMTMQMMDEVFAGQYNKALQTIQKDSVHYNDLSQIDIRIKAYELMGMSQQALDEVNRRRDVRDSLNSDMLFNNINEINAEMGIAKINEKAAKEREMWFAIVIILLVMGLGLVVSRYMMRRRHQKELMKQNKELEIALSRAEESDRMKDSFIQHVSHEIRTPLNVITGYAQIITNPDYELEEDERNHMLNDISKNTAEITYIVNELLEVADDESREHYQTNDRILVNEFCKRMIANAELINAGRLKLILKSELDDDTIIHSNRRVLEKIIDQLLNNAMKFTHSGYVELMVHQSPDHGVIRFIVTDSGIGISEQNQERVFERFFKEDPFKQGFGLGLTMCRKMATLLGGSLNLDKEYQTGARFILTLPTVSDQTQSS